MQEGWVCCKCGASNAPLLLQCPCSRPATSMQPSAASPVQSKQVPAAPAVAGSGSSSTKATAKQRQYVNYDDPLFLQFWENYPLHKGKAEAFKNWKKAVAAGADPEQLVAAAAAYARDPSRNPLKTKMAEGWLSGRRWEDEPVQLRHPLSAVDETDPATVVGTPEYQARQEAEWKAAEGA